MLKTRPLPDAKSFLAIEPLPLPSHRGKKITARNSEHYNCEEPTREQVRLQNYERRAVQMSSCGFRAVDYRPYKELEEVELDDRVLMLKAVGQHDREVADEVSLPDGESDDEAERNAVALISPRPSTGKGRLLSSCGPVMTPLVGGRLESLDEHLKNGLKRIYRVKQGHGLFGEIQEEERKRLEVSQEAARKEQELRRSEWNPPVDDIVAFQSSDEDEDSDENDDVNDNNRNSAASDPMLPSRIPSGVSNRSGGPAGFEVRDEVAEDETVVSDDEQDLSDMSDEDNRITKNGVVDEMPISVSHSRSTLTSPNHIFATSQKSNAHNTTGSMNFFQTSQSSFGTNASGETGDFNTVFRQLRSLQWILEAMVLKAPVCMPPIMSTWQTRVDVLRFIDSREILESRKERNDLWEKMATSQGQKKSVLVRAFSRSVKSSSSTASATSIQHHINASSERGRSCVLRQSSSMLDCPTGQLPDDERDAVYEATVALVTSGVFPSDISENEEVGQTPTRTPTRQQHHQPLKGALKGSVEPVKKSRTVSSLKPPTIIPRMTRGALLRHPSLKMTYPPDPQSRQSKPRPKSSPPIQHKLTPKQYDELVKLVEKPDYIHRRALAAVRKADREASTARRRSNVSLPSGIFPAVPCSFSSVDERIKFDDVTRDKELIVHEQLSAMQRDRYQTCRQKFMTLSGMHGTGRLWDDLVTIRADVATETASMARRKLLMNYHWYHDLIMDLPAGIQEDRLCAEVVLRLRELSKEFSALGPYRLSKARLLRVLASLRSWERESPDIKKAITFVRDHVIYTSLDEYETFMAGHETTVSPDRRPKSTTAFSLSKKPK